jgi:hypothetical protein
MIGHLGRPHAQSRSCDEALTFHLPGATGTHIGPETVGTQHITVGWATFPEGSAPRTRPPHPGRGGPHRLGSWATGFAGRVTLEPGVAVYIPIGTHHATVSLGPGPLEMVCSFSPPVAPGSYEDPNKVKAFRPGEQP